MIKRWIAWNLESFWILCHTNPNILDPPPCLNSSIPQMLFYSTKHTFGKCAQSVPFLLLRPIALVSKRPLAYVLFCMEQSSQKWKPYLCKSCLLQCRMACCYSCVGKSFLQVRTWGFRSAFPPTLQNFYLRILSVCLFIFLSLAWLPQLSLTAIYYFG